MPTPPNPDAGRARFAAATAAHLTAPLPCGVTLRHVRNEEIMKFNRQLWALDAREAATVDVLYTADVRARAADLHAARSPPLQHCLLLERDGQIVGSYWGTQESYGRYVMLTSVLHPDVRGQGLYTALLPRVVAAAQDSGFLEISSSHRADHNVILVLKLKAGFSIAAFEIDPQFGILVHLRKYLVAGMTEMFRYRVDGAGHAWLRGRGALP
jgi:GNAT superfamily N-acetyltransferase